MCGIVGALAPEGVELSAPVVQTMCDRLVHRGPDDEGFVQRGRARLGHRRLSVIDPTGSQQPLSNETGTVWAALNGEIYNYRQLRRQLTGAGHQFRTHGDTEPIVHLYEDHGPDYVQSLCGMFAICLWDDARQRLVLTRDRMGQKPLYYTETPDGTFLWASEPKAFQAFPGLELKLDLHSLARYLMFEYVPAPHSIYQGVRKLPRGCHLIRENGQTRVEPYWELRFEESADLRDETIAQDELWRLVRQSVERRLISDVPLGVFLSGGIDSSTVVAAMAELVPARQIKTFAIGFDDPSFDESAHARAVARHFGTSHHERQFDAAAMLDVLPEVADLLDEPFADASVLPTYLLSRFAREQVTVALGGDGGDELFAGYPTFQVARLARRLRHTPPWLRRAALSACACLPVSHANFSFDFKLRSFLRGTGHALPVANQTWLGSFTTTEIQALLTDPVITELRGFDPSDQVAQYAQEHLAGCDPIAELSGCYQEYYLAEDILTKTDRASMAHALEVRAPFLDHELVEFVGRLPSALKLRGRQMKYLLKQLMRKRLPAGIADRPKKGFGIPVAEWLGGPLQPLCRQLFARDRLAEQGLFRPEVVQRLYEEHLARRRNHRKPLWTLFMFQLWFDRYSS